MKIAACALIAGMVLLISTAQLPAQTTPPSSNKEAIPFKKDDDTGALLLRGLFGLVVALGIGVGALYLAKRAGFTGGFQAQSGRSLRLVESLRIDKSTVVSIVEFKEERFILACSGQALSLQAIQRNDQPSRSVPSAQQSNNNNAA